MLSKLFLMGITMMLLNGLTGFACSPSPANDEPSASGNADARQPQTAPRNTGAGATEYAVFGGGCFWCTEAVFEPLAGVSEVISGYAGGIPETANYEAVKQGTTDHAEVIRIAYDPAVISYDQLLEIFFTVAHDPTQLNRQGPDTGRQYRSVVFYANEEQHQAARAKIADITKRGVYDQPVVTTLESLDRFYPAEDYHQDYARLNPMQPYIRYHAIPKVRKLQEQYGDQIKD